VQADTIVPGAGNPAAWNRFSYVGYNPLKFIDPSGHTPECGPDGMFCSNNFEERYGISFSGEWKDRNKAIVRIAVQLIGYRFGAIMGMSSQMAFYAIFGGLNFDWVAAGGVSGGYGWAYDDHTIKFDGMYNSVSSGIRLVVHEIGHIFDRAVCAANNGGVCENIFGEGTARLGVSNYPTGTCFEENCLGRRSYGGPEEGQFWGFAGGVGFWQFGQVWADGVVNGNPVRVLDTAEIWADMFVGWTYNKWETDQVGQITARGATRQNYMNNSMSQYIQLIIGGK
jgi:hypothetical protein